MQERRGRRRERNKGEGEGTLCQHLEEKQVRSMLHHLHNANFQPLTRHTHWVLVYCTAVYLSQRVKN